MSKQHVSAAIESLLFVVGDEGLSIKQLQELLDVSKDEVSIELNKLMKEYEDEKRGLQLVEIAGQFQFATKQEYASYVEKLIEAPPAQSLSQAALETLAIVAYRQPITRAEIEEIRGVKTESTASNADWQSAFKRSIAAQKEQVRAILYGTTKEFLAYFGLKDLSELPPLPEDEAGAEQEADLFFRTFQETE
ncbi:SMC-Scp complex subunit ScpB [Priestia flexa]|nr:SMC-Scp complex subunit ScpB [Priestia flexa]